MSKTALITGVTGQDGSYLAELLANKGYTIHGLLRRSATPNLSNLTNVEKYLTFHYGDLSDSLSLYQAIEKSQPEEIYHLGAQSQVRISFDIPEYTADVTGTGTIRLLEAIKEINPKIRLYMAASSELFGKVAEIPQTEKTPFHPRSPYGCAKLFSYWATINYRESYNLHASNGILFNHTSPRRGENFVTRKITKAVARIHHGLQKELVLGNIEAKRDWMYAGDAVEAMYLMLQQSEPDDYVVGSGETHSIREFLEIAFSYVNLTWEKYVKFDSNLLRPAEVDVLIADPCKARTKLGWQPQVGFHSLVHKMLTHDLDIAAQERNKK